LKEILKNHFNKTCPLPKILGPQLVATCGGFKSALISQNYRL